MILFVNALFTGHIFNSTQSFHKVLVETPSQHSTVEAKYEMRFSIPSDNHCPVLYLRHDDQEQSYNAHKECFDKEKTENNFLKDKQLWWFKDCSHPSKKSPCRLNTGSVFCTETLQIALGYISKWYVSVGYKCGEEKPLDFAYNISITELDITCSHFNFMDFYSKPCNQFYNSYSSINLLGYDINDIIEFVNTDFKMFEYLDLLMEGGCYKYTNELGCRTLYPECRDGQLMPPCRQMCFDFLQGCKGMLAQKGKELSMSCTALPNTLDPGICVYKQVLCKHPGISKHIRITINCKDNNFKTTQYFPVGCTATYFCDNHMIMIGKHQTRACLQSGQWTGEAPQCLSPEYTTSFSIIIPIALTCALLPSLFICYLSIIQRFMYQKYPYKLHSRKLLSTIYKYDTEHIAYDVFLVYGSTENTRRYVQSLRENVSPQISFTSNDDILPGQREVPALDKAIAQSRCAVFVVAEDILESDNIHLIIDMVTANRYQREEYWCFFIMRSPFESLMQDSTSRLQPVITDLKRLSFSTSYTFKQTEFTEINSRLLVLSGKRVMSESV